ncbi:MAG: hypothetical protein GX763_01775 [Clostridiaceae bacterium]|nr:hypothetical protein [Clostridiaceae bacterium]
MSEHLRNVYEPESSDISSVLPEKSAAAVFSLVTKASEEEVPANLW